MGVCFHLRFVGWIPNREKQTHYCSVRKVDLAFAELSPNAPRTMAVCQLNSEVTLGRPVVPGSSPPALFSRIRQAPRLPSQSWRDWRFAKGKWFVSFFPLGLGCCVKM